MRCNDAVMSIGLNLSLIVLWTWIVWVKQAEIERIMSHLGVRGTN